MKLQKLKSGSATLSRSNPVSARSYFAALTNWGRSQERSSSKSQNDENNVHHHSQHHRHMMMARNQSSSRESYEDDPGIMSEVETSASGGFRRQTRARASLPILKSGSKTYDRSLGLVFLQFREETKRALLPNELTTLHTIKALFVRAFNSTRNVTLNYLDARNVRIYIHDPAKDMFYELEDVKDVKDRSVLRVYEQDMQTGTWQPVGGIRAEHPVLLHRQLQEQLNRQQGFQNQPLDDPSYFSEPEFETGDQQPFQRSRRERASFGGPIGNQQQPIQSSSQSQFYGTIILPHQLRPLPGHSNSSSIASNTGAPRPPDRSSNGSNSKPMQAGAAGGFSQTMPRGFSLQAFTTSQSSSSNSKQGQQRSVSPDLVSKRQMKEQVVMVSNVPGAPPKPQRSFTALIGGGNGSRTSSGHESMSHPGIDHSQSPGHQNSLHRPLPDRPFSVAGQYNGTPNSGHGPSSMNERRSFPDYSGYLSSPEHRLPPGSEPRVIYGQIVHPAPGQRGNGPPIGHNGTGTIQRNPMYNVTYGETVYNPYGPNARPASVAGIMMEDAVVARQKMESMERQLANLTGLVQGVLQPIAQNRQPNAQEKQIPGMAKPHPPPKPMSLVPGQSIVLNYDAVNQLRNLRSKAKDLQKDVGSLKKFARYQSVSARESLVAACTKIKTTIAFLNTNDPVERKLRMDRLRLSRDEDCYRGDVTHLNRDLTDLETRVEELRSNVINRRCKVNMIDVEDMAQVLSRASKVAADLKLRYPLLQNTLRHVMQQEMQVVVREEKFLKEEPEKLEVALRRCKKLTGTLVTLKRLASVQEQRSSATSNGSPAPESRGHDGHFMDKATSVDASSGTRDSSNSRSTERAPGLKESHTIIKVTPATPTLKTDPRAETQLDALLDELQTFSTPNLNHSKKSAPPPPPRSSSRVNENQQQQLIMLSSLTAAAMANVRDNANNGPSSNNTNNSIGNSSGSASNYSSSRGPQFGNVMRSNSVPASRITKSSPPEILSHNNKLDQAGSSFESDITCTEPIIISASNSSLTSIDSQEGIAGQRSRQQLLEDRHQELLKKQKLLQDQYTQLQLLSRGQLPATLLLNDLKKTGSESNIGNVSRPGGQLAHSSSGSLTQLLTDGQDGKPAKNEPPSLSGLANGSSRGATNGAMGFNPGHSPNDAAKHVETQKIYETDIL